MQNTAKMLIACPNCLSLGRRQVLGEIADGYLKVMRFHNAYTMIRGEFEVMCDKCNSPVYFRTNPSNVYGTVLTYMHVQTKGIQTNGSYAQEDSISKDWGTKSELGRGSSGIYGTTQMG